MAHYRLLEEAEQIGKPLFVWTVDDPVLTRALFERPLVEAIVTNNPRQALALRSFRCCVLQSAHVPVVSAALCRGGSLLQPLPPRLPPDADRQLAREIYKEMVEIRSGYTTGSTTPVAEAVAARLRAAGFPDSDIFVGGASPKKANLVVRYHGTGSAEADPAARPYRRGGGQPRGLEHRSVPVHRKRRLFLWPRHFRRQGASRRLDREPDSLQARGIQAGARYHRRPDRGRRRRRPLQRRHLAAQEQARIDRRRSLPERGRRGRDGGRKEDREQHPGQRKIVRRFQVRGSQQRRPQLRAGAGQRHLSPGYGARKAFPLQLSPEDR